MCAGAISNPFLAVVIFKCSNSFIDFYGLTYDGGTICPHFFTAGTISGCLGGPQNGPIQPQDAINWTCCLQGRESYLESLNCDVFARITDPCNDDYDNDVSDNCDNYFGTFDDLVLKMTKKYHIT